MNSSPAQNQEGVNMFLQNPENLVLVLLRMNYASAIIGTNEEIENYKKHDERVKLFNDWDIFKDEDDQRLIDFGDLHEELTEGEFDLPEGVDYDDLIDYDPYWIIVRWAASIGILKIIDEGDEITIDEWIESMKDQQKLPLEWAPTRVKEIMKDI